MTPIAERGTTIARVRLRGGGDDPLAARLRTAHALAGMGDLADAVPAAAILCVRRLSDPRPGHVALAHRPAPAAWTRAVRARVEDLARRAARPARDAVGDDAEAVVFADRAELLACLARDWCRGTLGRWWWRLLVGDGTGLDLVLRAWLDRPTDVAAALAQATSTGIASEFVRHLPPTATRALVEAVARSHALTRLAALTEASEAIVDVRPPTSIPPGADAVRDATARPAVFSAAPWRAWAPEAADPTLRPDQQLVLGVALTLQRAPVHARSAAFAAAAVDWWTAPGQTIAPGITVSVRPGEGGATEASPIVTGEPSAVPGEAAPIQAVAVPAIGDATAAPPRLPNRHREAPPVQAACAAPAMSLVTASPIVADGPAEGVSIATRYAGVFFLLNVALALELYGDFARPAARGPDLSIWDFVALVGQALLPGDALDRDPVCPLLAALAGRQVGARPEAGFDPPEAWRIPPAWLRAFPERGLWRWGATGDRLRVRHPAGFLVVDVPRTPARAAAQVREELTSYGARARRAARVVTGAVTADPHDRWLGWIVPYVRARLARALGVSRRAGAGRTVCRVAGRVVATSARVDVVLALADLPIAVRLGGLDRDPGWIPAADRIVSFRFE